MKEHEKWWSHLYSLFTKCHFLYSTKNKFDCWLQKGYIIETDISHNIMGTLVVTESDK